MFQATRCMLRDVATVSSIAGGRSCAACARTAGCIRPRIRLFAGINATGQTARSKQLQRSSTPGLLLLVLLSGWCGCSAAGRPSPGLTDVAGPRAYSNWQGQDPGGKQDAFKPQGGTAEAAAASKAKGNYFNGGKVVLASDVLPAGFAYGYAGTTEAGTAEASTSLTNGENNQIYGIHATAQTYTGTRAVAGSGTAYTLGDGTTLATTNAHNRYSYAASSSPSSRANAQRFKSVAFMDRAGTSVADSGKGDGPAALATAESVAAFSRADKDAELKKPIVTVGSREPGKGGAFERVLTRRSA